MSSKSKKSSPATGKTAYSCTITSSGASASPSSGRPASPTLISRLEEKHQLASLNDRLAAYIERVRSLEFDNEKLVKVVRSYEESSSNEASKIKALYDGELADARKLLDQMGKEKAKVQLELNKVRSDYDELLARFNAKERALADAEKRLLSTESQVNTLQARLADAANQRRQLEDELARIKKEAEQTGKQLAVAKKQLEDETIKRVDLENRIQSLKEQLAFQQELHEQELNSSMTQKKGLDVDLIEMSHQRDIESQLTDALRQMREENDEQISSSRAEIETVFQKKFNDLQNSSGHWQGEARKAQTEVHQLKSRIDSLNGEIEKIKDKANGSATRIEFLERLLQQERDDHASTIAGKDAEIKKLKSQLEDQLQEYRDLFDLKIQLDVEIAAYRKLLEVEECRLNSSQKYATTSGSGRRSFETSSTGSGRKRKLVEAEGGDLNDSYREYTTSSSSGQSLSKGGLHVAEVDADGRFVKLQNNSEKDIPLSGWSVVQSDESSEVSYKFLRSASIKPHQSLTLWSQDKTAGHSASDIVMKNQSWLKGENKKTVVIDNYGEETAWRESKRSLRTDVEASMSRLGALTRRGASSLITGIFP